MNKDRLMVHVNLMAAMIWAYFVLLLSDSAKSNHVSYRKGVFHFGLKLLFYNTSPVVYDIF